MKAILIDAKNKEIREVKLTNSLQNIYNIMEVTSIEVGFYLDNTNNCCYVDEEGMVNGTTHSFKYKDQNFMGNGLIVGTDSEGSDTDCTISIDVIAKLIRFPTFKHQKWAERLFDEKGISLDTDLANNQSVRSVLEFCAEVSDKEQDMVKDTLVKIDFTNGDILHFMNYLAKSIPTYSF